ILYVNGEQDQLFYPLSPEIAKESRAIPTYFYYTWQSPEGTAFDHHFYFDTEELTAAFKKLHQIEPATAHLPVRLTVKLIEHEKGRMVEVLLQHQDESIMLSKTSMKQYRSTKRQENKDTFYQD
ncbi:MAG: hypothetical protein GY829_15405, partial [Gammaproteobacteria bacterium]|nr:hypothetical protein [Gammaproteobacteria bacterium]